jgi:hypothetical protein
VSEPEDEKQATAQEQSSPRNSNRSTFFIAAGFVLALALLMALNWN